MTNVVISYREFDSGHMLTVKININLGFKNNHIFNNSRFRTVGEVSVGLELLDEGKLIDRKFVQRKIPMKYFVDEFSVNQLF